MVQQAAFLRSFLTMVFSPACPTLYPCACRRWLGPYLLRADASLGVVHWVALATALVQVAQHGTRSLLSLAGEEPMMASLAACLPA